MPFNEEKKTDLTDTTIPGQSDLSISNEGVLHIPQTPTLDSHYQMQFNVIRRTMRLRKNI